MLNIREADETKTCMGKFRSSNLLSKCGSELPKPKGAGEEDTCMP